MAQDASAQTAYTQDEETGSEPLHISLLANWCFRDAGSTCMRCVQACPRHAIDFMESNMPAINPSLCNECGICLGICDDFTDDRMTLEDIVKRVEYLSEHYGCAYLCCSEALFPGFYPARNVIVLPCLASIPPEVWTLLLAKEAKVRLYYEASVCDTCPVAAPLARPLFEYAIQEAHRITGASVSYAHDLPEQENIASEFIKSGSFERRGILSSTINSVNDLASGEYSRRTTDTALDALIRRQKVRAEGRARNGDRAKSITGGFVSRTCPPKHELAREIAATSPDAAARMTRVVSTTDERMCDNCASPTGKSFACTDVCPTHARRKVFGKEMLDYDREYCMGCGLCVPACPHHAITLLNTHFCD